MLKRTLTVPALAVILLALVACGNETPPAGDAPPGGAGQVSPTASGAGTTPGASERTGGQSSGQTPTATPESAPGRADTRTATDTPVAGLELMVDRGASWQELFDTLTSAEQACIREALGDEARALLARHILSDGPDDQWQVEVFSCLEPATARAVFLAGVIAGLEEDGVALGDEARACLREFAATLDVPAFMTASLEEDVRAIAEVAGGVWSCVPEVLFAGAPGPIDVDYLSGSERACLREWIRGLDVVALLTALSAGDNAGVVALQLGLLSCAPAQALAQLTGEAVELDGEAEECLRGLLAEADAAGLATAGSWDSERLFARLEDCVPALASGVPEGAAAAGDDHADSFDGATSIAVGEDVRGDLERPVDIDFFAFKAERGVRYEITVTLDTLVDSVLVLYDADWEELDFNDDDADSFASSITWEATYSGTHYLEVWGYDVGTYVLRVVAR